ncbi:MAG: AGE family epimerase/isomerase, partial [Muribaculaceae bacterium]|nr:AGE family epimerase/isomerase [Muribaculaceae bacterium]
AYEYIMSHFIDKEFGGVFWSLSSDGEPLDSKKQYYAIAFTIYGLSEYYLATGEEEVLDTAYLLFLDIENHARDMEKGGYVEASTRDWQPIEDMRLSDHDANASKTMNTHLHILEGYTALLRALRKRDQFTGINQEKVDRVTEATASLLNIFFDRIENPKTHHLTLFFDDDWQKYNDAESYGHDIEASWLLLETAEVIGDTELYQKALSHTERIALAALEGRKEDGSMVYELHEDGTLDTDRHWWVQAENVIGQLYLARFHSEPSSKEMEKWLDKAWQSWRYIADNLVDSAGEWYWSRKADGTINRDDDKAGFWKCPYHNSRMCLEATRILSQLN